MMPTPFSQTPLPQTPPTSARFTKLTFLSRHADDAEFTFRISPHPEMTLSFPLRPSLPRVRKRCRAMADIDGEHSCTYKKKRRLRLFLITSRLSPQFSHPATNIVDRGNSKIAVWAKQKALGRNLLRKAAILNRIRRQAMCEREASGGWGQVLVEQEREQEQLRLAKLAFTYGGADTYTRPAHQLPPSPPPASRRLRERCDRSSSSPSGSPSGSPSPPLRALDASSSSEYRSPNDAYSYSPPLRAKSPRRSYLPLPPSPLGLSNYDAFDLEDDMYAHLEDDYDMCNDADDSRDDSSFPFAATTAPRPALSRTTSIETSKTPPQAIYSDFSILDPDQPVFGDYDQVEAGADAIWPNTFAPEPEASQSARLLSSSPDFPALFATTRSSVAPSPVLGPSSFPDPPCAPPTPMSPNFAPPSTESALSPTASSPNFRPLSNAVDVTGTGSGAGAAYLPKVLRRGSVNEMEMEEERARQRRLMFMPFDS